MSRQQETLFPDLYREPMASPLAAARPSDPPSSHAAAERMNESGKAKRHRELVTDLVYRFPGRTSKELSKLTEDAALDYHEIARRLPEAEREGAIERRIEGKAPVTWWPRSEGAMEWVEDV